MPPPEESPGEDPLRREGGACLLTSLSLKPTPTQQGPGSPGGGLAEAPGAPGVVEEEALDTPAEAARQEGGTRLGLCRDHCPLLSLARAGVAGWPPGTGW